MAQRKSDLPQKICPVCGLPFAWRKKWERVWDEVRYCSERCRRRRGGHSRGIEGAARATVERSLTREGDA